jgi:hypothetical protein
MALDDPIGFPEFRQAALQALEPMLAAARSFVQTGQAMMKAPVSDQFPDLAKQITQTAANSMESVLILVSNGCGVDALRLARTMFEAAVTLNYLDSHPELVQDFVDYLWVIRKTHHEYRLTLPPDEVPPLSSEKIVEMESNYQRVKHRFVGKSGKPRNSWCKATLRDMAKEINAESMYLGLYTFGSSMTHSDILSIVAGAGESNEVEPVPSKLNLTLALQKAVVSFAMTLMVFDKIADLGRGDELEASFARFRDATVPPSVPSDVSVRAEM